VDPFNQLVFRVALQVLQVVAGIAGLGLQLLVDIGQGDMAVLVRLTGAEQIQVWAM
jgi:hypothetical protein